MSDPVNEVRTITDAERKILDILCNNPPSPRIQDRANTIRLSSQGYKATQIMNAITRNRATILRWIRGFNRRGTATLAFSAAPMRF